MSRFRNLVAGTASFATMFAQVAPLSFGMALVSASPAAAQRTVQIQCYSQPGQQNSCRLPAGTSSVTFMGPDRSGICREGQTWRKRGNSLWVANGCGGMFEASVQDSGGSGSGGGWGGSGGGWGGSGGNQGGNWGNQGWAGEITCRSRTNQPQTCRVNTERRVQLVQQISNAPCIEGQSWRYDGQSITVRNGCQARFAYGYGNQGGSGNGWGGSGGSWNNNRGYAGEIRCASRNNRYQRCQVDTGGRVELVERISNASCTQGSSWGHDRNSIWVNRGCEARFAYGYGDYQPNRSGSGSGSSSGSGGGGTGVAAGLLGAGLAAGLIAILNSRGHNASEVSSTTAARVNANYDLFPGAAKNEARLCLEEGARQLGATGATSVQLNAVPTAQQQAGGWRLISDVTGTWPRQSNRLLLDCTAAGGKLTAFDVRER